jgi:hypothetical protein
VNKFLLRLVREILFGVIFVSAVGSNPSLIQWIQIELEFLGHLWNHVSRKTVSGQQSALPINRSFASGSQKSIKIY